MKKIVILTIILNIFNANASLRDKIIQRRDAIKEWAPVCQSGVNKGQYSESFSECKQGDLAIFTGLGCLAATLAHDKDTIDDRCADIKLSQGADGRWWRGPMRVDNSEYEQNSFSRDQSKGVLAYFTARATALNENKAEIEEVNQQALNWISWMDNIGKGKMCTEATSNLCLILSSEPHSVLSAMKLFPKTSSTTFKNSPTLRHLHNLRDIFWTLPTETILTPKGYQLHLKASTLLIRRSLAMTQKISKREKLLLNATAQILYKKDSQNLYFEFLHKQKVTDDFARRVFEKCPEKLDTKDRYFDWQWQRDVEDQAFKSTNGHDCIFLMNLMLSKLVR